jgi:hypothetical protein
LLVNQLLSQQLSEEFSAVAAIEGQQSSEAPVRTESTRSSWAGISLQNNQHRVHQTSKDAVPHHNSTTKITTRNFCNEGCWPKHPKSFDV